MGDTNYNQSFRSMKKLRKYIKYFEESIDLRPNHIPAYVQAGMELKEVFRLDKTVKRFNRVLARLRKVIKKRPHTLRAYIHAAYPTLLRKKGFALAGQRKLDEASVILKEYVDLTGDIDVFYQITRLLTFSKEFVSAREILTRNESFLKKRTGDWMKFSFELFGINRSKEVYLSDVRKAQQDKRYRLTDVRPNKVARRLPMESFNQRELNRHETCVYFSKTPDRVNLNHGLDDLEGLLAKEVQELYIKGPFKQPIYGDSAYQVFTLPKARLAIWQAHSRTTTLISCDGEYIPQLIAHHFPVHFTRHALLKKQKSNVDSAFILPGIGVANYYHLLCDITGALAIYKKLQLDGPIIFPETPNNIQEKILEAVDIPSDRVLSAKEVEDVVFDVALAPARIPYFWDKMLVNFYRDVSDRIHAGSPAGTVTTDRIYISRRKNPIRPLTNEDRVEKMLRSRGFSVVCMEDYPFEEQIRIMKNAAIVVAPQGAGLTNIIFSPPGLIIVELIMDRMPKPNFYFRGTVCGHKYYPILGRLEESILPKKAENFRWKVNTNKLQRVLDKII